jgi:hypothetical protein
MQPGRARKTRLMRIDATQKYLGKMVGLGIGEVHRAPGVHRAGTKALMLTQTTTTMGERPGPPMVRGTLSLLLGQP